MSTDSGIPDYRGPTSIRATPMQYSEFVGSESSRQRYWARSYLGWRQIGQAAPNDGHRALVDLEQSGLVGVLTQNVDGLHAQAGSSAVINLHGEINAVICLDCGERSSRLELQARLAALNPDLDDLLVLEHAELRPDGDAVVEDWSSFELAGCLGCGGRLKPDVVFFGETVPRDRVDHCFSLVDGAGSLLVLGSSLTVMSGYRFVLHAAKLGVPVAICTVGPTRGDAKADVRVDAPLGEVLPALAGRLAG